MWRYMFVCEAIRSLKSQTTCIKATNNMQQPESVCMFPSLRHSAAHQIGEQIIYLPIVVLPGPKGQNDKGTTLDCVCAERKPREEERVDLCH